ncbi:MAG: type IV toxin-antitoxin system AbiEi family antitoxin domain-containing protein [Actinomycetota bacterium]|nr:type IV toxin-antitoxin system AbiEi family antitoxin domain-containing protein [Actinomycetota bacterium]
MDADERLARWAARHHGLFRAEDALRSGLSRRQIGYRIRQGRTERVGQNVYRFAGSADTPDQRVLSAAWRAGGVASHRTGIDLFALMDRGRRRPHVTVDPTSGHELPDVVIHRSGDLVPSDLTVVRSIPVTTPARALVDVGLVVSDLDLEKIVHRALHRGLTTIEELRALYRRISRRGRHGSGPIGELLAAYDDSMPAAESDLEVVILRVLREHGVPAPVRQFVVETDDWSFRLDLAYPQHCVFLEGDGFGVHGGRGAFEDDRWRQNLLVAHGWWPLRATWRQAHERPREFAAIVQTKLDEVERTWR